MIVRRLSQGLFKDESKNNFRAESDPQKLCLSCYFLKFEPILTDYVLLLNFSFLEKQLFYLTRKSEALVTATLYPKYIGVE